MMPPNPSSRRRLLQIPGMGQVNIGGSSPAPGVRAEVNPLLLSKLGIGLDQVRAALNTANADVPKGALANDKRSALLDSNDQLFLAREYASLIVAYHNGAPVRLSDVATVVDGPEERIRNEGYVNGRPGATYLRFVPPATGESSLKRLTAFRAGSAGSASLPSRPPCSLSFTEDSTRMIRAFG